MKRQQIFFNHKDPSKTSVVLLTEKTRSYLKKQFDIDHSWCPDYFEWYPTLKEEEILDIVFFGDFFRKFLELSFNPNKRFRLWVLSKCSKDALVNSFFIPSEKISIIPRYELFPVNPIAKKIDLSQPLSFIYSGQIREEKGILLLLYTVFRLQTEFSLNVHLEIYGDFFLGIEAPEQARIDYKEKIIDLINMLQWKITPKLNGFIENEFLLLEDNSIYISLSHFLTEDFNTSLAKAQSLGMPACIGHWGGHRDALGDNILHIPFDYIGPGEDTINEAYFKSIGIAHYIFKNLNVFISRDSEFQYPLPAVNLPEVTSKNELTEIHQLLSEKWNPIQYFMLRRYLHLMDDHQLGYEFIKRNINAFSSPRNLPRVIIIVNRPDDKVSAINEKLEKYDWIEMYKNYQVEFIHLKSIKYKVFITDLFLVQKIIIPFDYGNLPILSAIISFIDDGKIEIESL